MYFLLPLFIIKNCNMLASGWLLDSMTDKVFSQLPCRDNWLLEVYEPVYYYRLSLIMWILLPYYFGYRQK